MPSIIKVDQIQSDTGNVAISGNVSSTLRVSNTGFPLIVRSGGTNHITMFDTRSSTGVGTMIGANQDGNTYYDSNYNGTATAGGHIWRSGGNDILTLGATGLLTTTAGIKFPGTQVSSADANTLDDYEEGTWTPTYTSTGATWSYAARSGAYVKIGQMVYAQFYLYATASGTTTNEVVMSNLPFTSFNDPVSGAYHQAAAPVWYTNSFVVQPLVNNNSTLVSIWKSGAIALAIASEMSNRYFVGSAVYRAAS